MAQVASFSPGFVQEDPLEWFADLRIAALGRRFALVTSSLRIMPDILSNVPAVNSLFIRSTLGI
jgi:hypothetical protein